MSKRLNLLKLIVLIIFLGFIAVNSDAQVLISNVEKIPELQGGVTYVVMNDPDSEIAKEYKRIYRKYWTFTRLDFICKEDMSKVFGRNVTFLTFRWELDSYRRGSYVYLYLSLWYPRDRFFMRNKKFSEKDIRPVARIQMFPDHNLVDAQYELFRQDADLGGRVRNWDKGYLKNYIQQINQGFTAKKEITLKDKIINKEKLKVLRNEKLYIPDYVLIKFNEFTDSESDKLTAGELMKDYVYDYEIVSIKELNDRILKDTNPFYYLMYTKSQFQKTLSIINSATGEVMYSEHAGSGRNLKAKDIRNMAKNI
ncbi:MAG: hypothetical protein WD077_01525 [Bacteroidia bacterium]